MKTTVLIAAAVAGAAVWVWLAGSPGGAEAAVLGEERGIEEAELELASEERVDPRDEVETDEAEDETAKVEAPVLDAASLRAQLEAVARAEQALVGLPVGERYEEARRALEEALRPILFEPRNVTTILELLQAGTLSPGVDAATMRGLSLAEFGAVRALYWAVLAYTSPRSEVLAQVAVDGGAVLVSILSALPSIEPRVTDYLLRQLINARTDGVLVIDKAYLDDILFLRSKFPDHQELFSALLENIGESMTPEEREAIFTVLLDDSADPKMIGVTLTNLLRSESWTTAMSMAEALFDATSAPAEELSRRREAVALAVARSTPDPDAAVDFLTERVDATRNMLVAYWTLAEREGGPQAMEARYHELAAADADPKSRYLMVLGMQSAAPERLLAIAAHDSDPLVRGQALVGALASPETPINDRALATLEQHVGSSGFIAPSTAVQAAAALAQRAKQQGSGSIAQSAVDVLRRFARDESWRPGERRSALESLKRFVSKAEYEQLAQEIEARAK
jgi:hypothetical protein